MAEVEEKPKKFKLFGDSNNGNPEPAVKRSNTLGDDIRPGHVPRRSSRFLVKSISKSPRGSGGGLWDNKTKSNGRSSGLLGKDDDSDLSTSSDDEAALAKKYNM